ANSGYTIAVADRSLDESAQVLKAIFDFAESDRFVREVRWYLHDVIVWDNRFLTHIASVNSGPEADTMMYRITLCDDFPLSANQPAKMAAAERGWSEVAGDPSVSRGPPLRYGYGRRGARRRSCRPPPADGHF